MFTTALRIGKTAPETEGWRSSLTAGEGDWPHAPSYDFETNALKSAGGQRMEAVQSQLPRNGDFITGQEAWPTSGEVKWYVLERVAGEAVSQLHHPLAR